MSAEIKIGKHKCCCEENHSHLLLVEGNNDCHVIMHLCRAHELPESLFCIHNCQNDDGVLKELTNRLKARPELRPQVVGVVLDADKPEANPNLTSRLQQVCDRLSKISQEYQRPQAPDPSGTILTAVENNKYPRIGIWLMPNNQEIGMLEDFLMELASKKTNTEDCCYADSFQYAQQCVDEAMTRRFTSFKNAHKSKAIIHTYLAWHKPEPGTSLAMAITAHTLEPNTPLAYQFTTWLRKLFETTYSG